MQGHTEIIWAIEVRGDRVYTASADKTVRVWDLNTKRCLQVGGRLGGCLGGWECRAWYVLLMVLRWRVVACWVLGRCAAPCVSTASCRCYAR